MEISQIHTCTPRPGSPAAPRAPNQTRQLLANQVPAPALRKAGADDEVIVYKGNGDHVGSWRIKNAHTLTISAMLFKWIWGMYWLNDVGLIVKTLT